MGIGVNTGPVVYGNTGSLERFDFTVLGDDVNLASRLEGANKEYGSNIIVGPETFRQVQGRGLVFRSLDVIEVQGKTEPVAIYELLGENQDPSVPSLRTLSSWDAAIALYRSRDFVRAEQAFNRVLEVDPSDGPARMYMARCTELQVNPPDVDWDGVFVMTHK